MCNSANNKCKVTLYKVALTEVLSSFPMVAAILDYVTGGTVEHVITHVLNSNLSFEGKTIKINELY